MAAVFSTLTVLAFISSVYLSSACFCIVRRMNRATPWSLAIAIISIAALGAYAFLESFVAIAQWAIANYSPLGSHLPPLVAIATVIAAIVLENMPELNV